MGAETIELGIIIPATAHNPRDVKIHRGTVVQLGPPGVKHGKHPRAPVVPWDVEVGDEVFFTFSVWLESRRHTEDENVVVIAQSEIQAVITP
jgi:co-chaperonin GroES (HSP10)